MTETLTYTGTLVITSCKPCGGMRFAIPASLEQEAREQGRKHRGFYCPNGHQLWYMTSEADELRAVRDRLERQNANLAESVRIARAGEQTAEHRARAYKGVATKVRRRAAHGVCPVPGCKRSFANVAAHVGRMHPDYAAHLEVVET